MRSIVLFLLVLTTSASSSPSPSSSAASSSSSSSSSASPCSFPAMFVFGDSLSDTGNIALSGVNLKATRPPQGITFPGHPFNRFCDGRLIVDFMGNPSSSCTTPMHQLQPFTIAAFLLAAIALRLPFLHPYLNSSEDFSRGVNYAVAGATALNIAFLATRFNISTETPNSLEVQLGWHLELKAAVSSADEQPADKPDPAAFSNGLYIIGIGGNDYSLAFEASYTPAYVNHTIVPFVIQKIKDVTEALYSSGARNFLFITVAPFGCQPSILATYVSAKDSDGCLTEYNSVPYQHRVSLMNELEKLRATHPNASFVFGDLYGIHISVLRNMTSFGFEKAFDACCGAGPSFPYSYYSEKLCSANLYVCRDRFLYLSWDGSHYTDKFNSVIANRFITDLSFNSSKLSSNCCHQRYYETI